jgi:hypothetical protein
VTTEDPTDEAEPAPAHDWFDRVVTRVGDLDSSFYDEERDRDVGGYLRAAAELGADTAASSFLRGAAQGATAAVAGVAFLMLGVTLHRARGRARRG